MGKVIDVQNKMFLGKTLNTNTKDWKLGRWHPFFKKCKLFYRV